MPRTYNIHEAKTHLSRLVEEAAVGEEIIIAKSGKPRAKLVPFDEKPERKPGRFRTDIQMTEDFFESLPEEELEVWEGNQE
jgi:prevent-host-death family protein